MSMSNPNAPLEMTLLGEFAIRYQGELVPGLNADRPQSLLTYLLLHRHAPQPRHLIAFTLWPDSSDAQARTNLRNLLYILRTHLPEADRYLDVSSLTLQWRPAAPFTLDVAQFAAALTCTQQTSDPADRRHHLETAITLYKGDLLPGNYDDWLVPLREQLRHDYLGALHQLIALLEQQHDYRVAIRYGQRLLQLDPLDEIAYVHLMRLHALSGDRAGVRRVYEQCATTLQRELDITPSPNTQQAYEQFLRQEAAPDAAVAPSEPVTVRPQPTSPPLFRPPAQPTPFVGREKELAHLAEWLAQPPCRLVTLVGPGGVGKTRLAMQSATGHVPVFKHGAAFISLAPLRTPEHIPLAIADALHISFAEPGSHQKQLTAFLQDKEMLLVLDNFEHLQEAADDLTDWLAAAPGLKLLVTSRQRLGLHEEWVFDLQGLSLPDAQTSLADNEAVTLFVQTAQRVNRHFTLNPDDAQAVRRICQLVGGMPLGLELAAASVHVLNCAEIAAEIERDFDFLSSSQRNVPERHRSMRAVFEYSWRLLALQEQQALSRLSLFRGGFTREAAQTVAGAGLPILTALIDKSLVSRVAEGRFDLHELIRQFAQDYLADGAAAQKAYATYYENLAVTARRELQGPNSPQWLARLDAEIDNLRAALAWSIEQNEVEIGLRMGGALWRYWWWRGYWHEGLEWLEKLLERGRTTGVEATLPPRIRAVANQGAGILSRNLGDYSRARAYYQISQGLYREANHLPGVAAALNSLGTLALFEGKYAEAESHFAAALEQYRQTDDKSGTLAAMNNQGIAAMYQGEYQRAWHIYEAHLALAREENNPVSIAMALGNLGDALRHLQRYDEAQAALDESLSLLRELNNPQALGVTLYGLGRLALEQGEVEQASGYFHESLNQYREVKDLVGIADLFEGLARVAVVRGQYEQVAQWLAAAANLRQRTGTPIPLIERTALEQAQAIVQAALGDEPFQTAWVRGKEMTLDEAFAAAFRA